MQIITLVTDWGSHEAYVGALKASLISKCESALIIDISNDIKPFDKIHAAYVLRNSYHLFPKGTLHICSIGGNLENNKTEFITFSKNGYFFSGTDNGIWGLVFDDSISTAFNIDTKFKQECNHAFPELSVFSHVADCLLNKNDITLIGEPTPKLNIRHRQFSIVKDDYIFGEVMHIDSFGNAVTNISIDDFERVHKNRPFVIHISSTRYTISKINKSYDETENGELLAIFSYTGMLEIAVSNGSAKDLINIAINNSVTINFDETETNPSISAQRKAPNTLFF